MDLSIIIPVYNVENYLEECLESVYNLKIDKEIILINDASTDSSVEIINKYKKKYQEITKLKDIKKNSGLSSSRNTGLEMAEGKYIFFLDSDDFILTEEFELFFGKAKKMDLDILTSDVCIYYDENKKIYENRKELFKDVEVTSGIDFFEKINERCSHKVEVWRNIYKREFLLENNLKFVLNLLHEDILFSFKALYFAKKVCYSSEVFYMYRQREGSIMKSKNEKNYRNSLYIINEICDLVKDKKMNGLANYLIKDLYYIYRKTKKTNKKILNKVLNLGDIERKLSRKKNILKIVSFFKKDLLATID